jgi:uncharacterized membrane protein YfcA
MYQFVIKTVLGLISGLFLGITGILPIGLLLIALDILKIGDYKSNLGAILFFNLFPITIGSFFDFYKANQINFSLGVILLASVTFGSFIGSKYVVGEKIVFSVRDIKYITAYLSIFVGIVFLISAYYEKK